jgi:hypothetical protein
MQIGGEQEKEQPVVRCPTCGRAMVRGYSHAACGIQWRSEFDRPKRWTVAWRFLPSTVHWWSMRENVAWHCSTCSIVVIDHSASVVPRRERMPHSASLSSILLLLVVLACAALAVGWCVHGSSVPKPPEAHSHHMAD